MPRGFEVEGKNVRSKVLKLFKMFYGLFQSPRAIWKYMTANMKLCGMQQPKMDHCLFIGNKVVAIIYVADILFCSVDENNSHDLAMNLRSQGVYLEQEYDAAGFLGVTLSRDEATGLMEMKQVGLIDRVIETLGLDDGMEKNKYTPS